MVIYSEFPIQNGDFPVRYAKLPEGTRGQLYQNIVEHLEKPWEVLKSMF